MEILEIELLSNDIEGTYSFYTKILGLQVILRNDLSVSFAAGSTRLTFRFSKKQKPVYHFAFDIPKNQLLEAFAWIDNGTEILEVIPPDKIADFYNWNAKSFYFYDNNGNIVECIARFNLEIRAEKPFDGSSIISVSEIGLVAKNVSKFCDELVGRYHLPVFSMQPKLANFIVLGTETGLFILAEEGKDWYPTKIKARSFWTKLVFANNGKIQEIEVV
jgi:catechol 2,3-dioxygenase-like lactoylglutathione lyase family enzyme